MTRKDADDLRALADLFRQRRRSVVIIADDDDQDPVGVHHGHSHGHASPLSIASLRANGCVEPAAIECESRHAGLRSARRH
jgi:hypothetical protein